ncbi:MAG: phenylalanine--tRNA ligase subunit beta, partial [Acidimicrobiales bacterium]
LELTEDHDGILVLGSAGGTEAPDSPAPGQRLVDALGIVPDVVFDIAVEANRPDAWSMAGVARDLAARMRLPFTIPDPPLPPTSAAADAAGFTLEVLDTDLCPRFTARALSGVVVGPSPDWVARRVTLAGMRPINNVVDASNYVMLELGQPTHPYDLDRVAGGGLRVRAARPGEVLVTLDGVERRLGDRAIVPDDDRRDCVICDADDTAIGIGGVMGGGTTEISATTGRVLLEAAYFTPMAVARTTKRLGLRSEASARFERGCDPQGIDRAALRLCQILGLTAGPDFAVAGTVVDIAGEVPGPGRVRVRTARVNALLGSDLDDAAVAGYLEPIGFGCTAAGDGTLEVEVPTFRPDTGREVDVIEEVARHLGYSTLPRRRPSPPQVGALSAHQKQRRLGRSVLAGFGAHEAWTPSLLAPGDHRRAGLDEGGVTVANPLTPDETVLRRSLLPGLLKALAFNADRRLTDVRLFELGHVFPPPDAARVERAFARTGATVIDEREMLAAVFSAPGDDARTASAAWLALAEAMGVLGVALTQTGEGPPSPVAPGVDGVAFGGLHPSRAARLVMEEGEGGGGRVLGVVGEVDPDVVCAFGLDPERQRVGYVEIDLGLVLDEAPRRRAVMAPVSRFPSSDIDLAFVVDESVAAGAVGRTLRRSGGG